MPTPARLRGVRGRRTRVAYAHAVEESLGLVPDRELRAARTVLLELERLYNHLHDISAICAGVGLAPGAMAFAALKDRAQQINARAFGHRFLFGTVAVGRGAVALDAPTPTRRAPSSPRSAPTRPPPGASSSSPARCRRGSTASACSTRVDARTPRRGRPRGARRRGPRGRPEREPAPRVRGVQRPRHPSRPTATSPRGSRMRAVELEASCELLETLLAAPARARRDAEPTATAAPARSASGASRAPAERPPAPSSSTATGSRALHLRTGSYANWPALAHATAGNLVPDFPLINKSFELCYACVDR